MFFENNFKDSTVELDREKEYFYTKLKLGALRGSFIMMFVQSFFTNINVLCICFTTKKYSQYSVFAVCNLFDGFATNIHTSTISFLFAIFAIFLILICHILHIFRFYKENDTHIIFFTVRYVAQHRFDNKYWTTQIISKVSF